MFISLLTTKYQTVTTNSMTFYYMRSLYMPLKPLKHIPFRFFRPIQTTRENATLSVLRNYILIAEWTIVRTKNTIHLCGVNVSQGPHQTKLNINQMYNIRSRYTKGRWIFFANNICVNQTDKKGLSLCRIIVSHIAMEFGQNNEII